MNAVLIEEEVLPATGLAKHAALTEEPAGLGTTEAAEPFLGAAPVAAIVIHDLPEGPPPVTTTVETSAVAPVEAGMATLGVTETTGVAPVPVAGTMGYAAAETAAPSGPSRLQIARDSFAALSVGDALDVWQQTRVKNHDQASAVIGAPKLLAFQNAVIDSKGLMYISHTKAGIIVSGESARGWVISRLPAGGWSAPLPIRMFGMGVGATLGMSKSKQITFLQDWNDVEVLKNATPHREMAFGMDVGLAAGSGLDKHRSQDLGTRNTVKNTSYAIEKGALVDIDLGASRFKVDELAIRDTYGRDLPPKTILESAAPVEFDPLTGSLDSFIESVHEGTTPGQQRTGGVVQKMKDTALKVLGKAEEGVKSAPGGTDAVRPRGAHGTTTGTGTTR